MSKYQYTNLCSIYSYKCNGYTYRAERQQDVCFGKSLTNCIRIHNEVFYKIALIKNTNFIDVHDNNYCWMNKHQIENYLRRIASIKPFKYRVYEGSFRKTSCYNIDLSMNGTKKEITFVLQSIKRMYEFPYNFFLLQAYKMQALPEFKFDSILNLFNVIYGSFYPGAANSGHSYSGASKFEKYRDIKAKLPSVAYTTQIYPKHIPCVAAERLKGIYYYNNCPADTDQWNEDLFRRLLPTYITNYKRLKV